MLSPRLCPSPQFFLFFGKYHITPLTDAQYYIGILSFYGDGVEKDVAAAVKHFRAAAEQGHVQAMVRMPLCPLTPLFGCNWSIILFPASVSTYVLLEAGIDTSAHAVGHAHKRGNFVPSLCARPARACRASLSADTETEHPKSPLSRILYFWIQTAHYGTSTGAFPDTHISLDWL